MALVTFGDRNKTRSNNFVFLRFLMASLVILRHTYRTLYGPDVHDPFAHLTRDQTQIIGVGVNYFFVMSGFLITAAWMNRKSVKDYLSRRFLRLYPGAAVMSLVCLFVIGPLSVRGVPGYLHTLSIRSYLSNLAHLRVPPMPGVFSQQPLHNGIYDQMWTIMYQFRLYLIVPLLGLLGAYRRRGIVLFLFLASLTAFGYQTYVGIPYLQGRVWPIVGPLENWPHLFTFFASGMVCYLYRDMIPYSRKLFVLSAAVLMASCYAGLAVVMPLAGSYMMFYAAFCQRLPFQKFAGGNDYSYGMYIYSLALQQLLVQYFGPHLRPVTMYIASMAVTVPVAYASYHLVEARFIKRKATRAVPPVAVPEPVPVPERVPAAVIGAPVTEAASPLNNGL